MTTLFGRRRSTLAAVGLVVAALALGAGPASAAPAGDTAAPAAVAAVPKAPPAANRLLGDYLAGRHAQETRNYIAASDWFGKAIAADPDSPELISRTFLMEVCAGRFDRAAALAPQELKLDPSDAVAELVLVLERLKAGDAAGAAKEAAALPSDGLHRFVAPFALAWTRMATGDLAGADMALQGLDKFNGFQPLKLFQLGIVYDFAGKPDKAQQYFEQTLAATHNHLNWRLVDVIGNFDQRHGRTAQAKALYRRFIKESGGSDMGLALAAERAAGAPQAPVRSASDGLAEAMFDLASVLDQAETIDLSLVYDRFALALRPDFPLATLLLSDILGVDHKPAESLAALDGIPQNSPYYGAAQLRRAINLETLGRRDEAIALLRQTAAAHPTSIGAELELGDILRDKKDFAAAVTAYDEAIRRAMAAGLPVRWSMLYDRGVALERSGQWQRAEGDLLHALKLKPDQPMVLNYLGYSWIDRGENLQRGLKMIESAVALRPDDGYIIDSLGWAHYRLGDYAGAVKYLEKATELVPQDPTINDHLGDAYWRIGRLVEARYQWRYALQFGPEKSDIRPIEAKLEHGLAAVARPHGG